MISPVSTIQKPGPKSRFPCWAWIVGGLVLILIVGIIAGLLLQRYGPWDGDSKDFTKLLVIGQDRTEVLDLEDPALKCSIQREFQNPFPGIPTAMGIIDDEELDQENILVMCGSSTGDEEESNKCYFQGGNNMFTLDLLDSRIDTAGIVVGNYRKLWITGGWNGDRFLSSSEFVTMNGSISGPSLPESQGGHCLTMLDDNRLMMVGGGLIGSRQQKNKVHVYDFKKEFWIRGPDIGSNRNTFACGTVTDLSEDNLRIAIVAGGVFAETSTEIWLQNGPNGASEWTVGPDVPVAIHGAGAVSTSDGSSLIVVGGGDGDVNYKTLYSIQCSLRICEWSKMEHELMESLYSPRLLLVPDSYVECD